MASEEPRQQTTPTQDNVDRASDGPRKTPSTPGTRRASASTRRPAPLARLLPTGIRERLFLLIALALLPMLVLQGWVYYRHHTARRNEAMQTELEVAQGVATTFVGYLNDIRRQLETVGRAILTFAPYTDAKATHLLEAASSQYTTVRNMNWVDPQGRIQASSLPALVGRDLSGRTYFQQILAGQSWALGDLMPTGSVTETPIFVIASAVHDDQGTFRGVVAAAIEPAHLGEQTFAAERPGGGAYAIFDHQGNLVYRSPEVALTWEQRTQWRRTDPLLRQALDGRVAQGAVTSIIGGDPCIAARVPIAGIDWVAGASRPMRAAMGPVWLALVQEASLGLLVTLSGFLLAYIIARTIADPLERLEQEAERMGEGRIGPVGGSDGPTEVRRLHATMTQMATDLIHRAESLRRSEERFRKLFEADLIGAYVTKPDGTFLNCNDKMVSMLGYDSREEILRHRSTDFYVDPQFRQEAVRILLRDGIFPGREGLLRRKDGTTLHALGFAVLLRDEQTGEPYIQGVAVDITEQKRIERALQEAEALARDRYAELNQIYRYAPVGLFTLDRQCRVTRVNEQMADINGFPVEYHIGRSIDEIVPDLADRLHGIYRPVFERGEPVLGVEHHGQTPKAPGVERDWIASYFPLRSANGEVTGLIGAVLEVTDRRRAEQALRESEAKFRSVFEQAAIGMGRVCFTTARWIDVNDAFCRMLGYSREEMRATPWPEITHPDDVDLDLIPFRRMAAGELDSYTIEKRFIHKQGHPIWARLTLSLVRDAQGRPDYEIAIIEDVTGRKQAEESLRELTATLESRVAQRTAELEQRARQLQKLALELSQAEDRERRRLADILHDDLQQQLAAVKFHIGLLSRQAKGNAALQETVAPAEAMIKDAIAKSRSLSHELSPALLYHGDFGETIAWLANQIHAKHGLVVHTDIRGQVEVQSDAIKSFLFRAAREILFNVVKHAHVTQATVRLRRRRERLWLTVCDKGRGFDPKALEQTAGFGLLSIRERVELLGGRMKIRSAPGRGSTFLIAVPDEPAMTEAAGPETVGVAPPVRPAGDGPLRVLLADDHKVVREGLAALLNEQEDIEVIGQAANGREAVDLAHELRPDVVVMDVAMPLMEGDEATRRIKRDLPRTRIVGLSMHEEAGTVEKMRRAGAEQYMLKSAPSEELLAAIRGR